MRRHRSGFAVLAIIVAQALWVGSANASAETPVASTASFNVVEQWNYVDSWAYVPAVGNEQDGVELYEETVFQHGVQADVEAGGAKAHSAADQDFSIESSVIRGFGSARAFAQIPGWDLSDPRDANSTADAFSATTFEVTEDAYFTLSGVVNWNASGGEGWVDVSLMERPADPPPGERILRPRLFSFRLESGGSRALPFNVAGKFEAGKQYVLLVGAHPISQGRWSPEFASASAGYEFELALIPNGCTRAPTVALLTLPLLMWRARRLA